jgi:hypothetical protein
VLLAVACFAKIWPLALVPAFLVRRSARSLAAFVAVGTTSLGAWVWWAGVAGPVQVLTFRGARGWQIESLMGSLLHAVSYQRARMERGALRVGVVPGWARIGLPLTGLLVVALVWILVARIPELDARVGDGLGPVAAITALLVFATILSPQYVSWLLPFAAIAGAGGERLVAWLAGAAAFLSTVGLRLMAPLSVGEALPVGVVLARNALLVALLGTAIHRLIRLARQPNNDTPVDTPFVLQVSSLPVSAADVHAPAPVSRSRRPLRPT